MGIIKAPHSTQAKKIYRDQLVTIGDLEDFKSGLLRDIKKLIVDHKGPESKKWLKSYEVKKMLQVSSGTLQTLRNTGTLPYTKIGGIFYYSVEDIEKLLSDKEQPLLLLRRHKGNY